MINFGKDFFRIKGFFQKEDEEIIEFALSKEGKKALYLATKTATKKWSQPLRNWATVYGEFQIMYGDYVPLR